MIRLQFECGCLYASINPVPVTWLPKTKQNIRQMLEDCPFCTDRHDMDNQIVGTQMIMTNLYPYVRFRKKNPKEETNDE